MQKGFIGSLIFIIVLALAGFFLYSKSVAVSSDKTQKAAQAIRKYPNTSSWELSIKSFCFLNISSCVNPPAKIKFQSDQSWNRIYAFYKEWMRNNGWSTNSLIVTSIPSSIVFQNAANCEAELKEGPGFQFFQKNQAKNYLFTAICK